MTTLEACPSKKYSPVLPLAGAFALLVAAAIAKKSGAFDPVLATRIAGSMISLVLVLAGNQYPKLTQPLTGDSERDARVRTADRWVGRILVSTGILGVASWVLFAPRAAMGAAGITGGLGLGGALVFRLFRTRGQDLPSPASPRGALLNVFFGLFWAFGMFTADLVWGDSAIQGLAVLYVLAHGTFVTWLARASTSLSD